MRANCWGCYATSGCSMLRLVVSEAAWKTSLSWSRVTGVPEADLKRLAAGHAFRA